VTVVGRSLSHADRTSCLGAPVLRAVSSGMWRHDHLTSTTLPAGCTIKPPDAGSRQCPWVTALLKEQLASSTPSGSWPKLTPNGQHAWLDTNRSSGACSNACGRTGSNRLATRSPGLQIRRFLCGHPDPFRSVRDLGLVPARCSGESGISESRSPRWLPAWLPVSEGLPHRSACRGPSAFRPDISPVGVDRASVMRCHRCCQSLVLFPSPGSPRCRDS
jgi:hypothetical protein